MSADISDIENFLPPISASALSQEIPYRSGPSAKVIDLLPYFIIGVFWA